MCSTFSQGSLSVDTIADLVSALKKGEIIILLDDEARENEGDMIIAADKITPEAINFMLKAGCGVLCLTMTESQASRLELTSAASHERFPNLHTNFSQSIDAAFGISTGTSVFDRTHTIKVAISKDARPEDLIRPGHVFPIIAAKGGVLERPGHTEASCELAAMAGLTPTAVIIEVLEEDGSMARRDKLLDVAKTHSLKIGTINDLIAYRKEKELLDAYC